VIVDAVEHVVEIGLRIEPFQFCGLDDCYGTCERFAASVGAREEPVLSAYAQFPFILPMSGRFIGFIIDGMPILKRT
jgi:hypothetical protein